MKLLHHVAARHRVTHTQTSTSLTKTGTWIGTILSLPHTLAIEAHRMRMITIVMTCTTTILSLPRTLAGEAVGMRMTTMAMASTRTILNLPHTAAVQATHIRMSIIAVRFTRTILSLPHTAAVERTRMRIITMATTRPRPIPIVLHPATADETRTLANVITFTDYGRIPSLVVIVAPRKPLTQRQVTADTATDKLPSIRRTATSRTQAIMFHGIEPRTVVTPSVPTPRTATILVNGTRSRLDVQEPIVQTDSCVQGVKSQRGSVACFARSLILR